MRRSEARQGVRKLKFMDALGRQDAAELNQLEAADLLGVNERTFRRWCRRHEEEGEAGLLDHRLGKASGKRVPVDRCEEVERLYRTCYLGFTARHFHEHLVREHRFARRYSWTKIFLRSRTLLPKTVRRQCPSVFRASVSSPDRQIYPDPRRHRHASSAQHRTTERGEVFRCCARCIPGHDGVWNTAAWQTTTVT